MKKIPLAAALVLTAFFVFVGNFSLITKTEEIQPVPQPEFREITGEIEKGETLFDVFNKYKLDLSELYKMRQASANIHRLREMYPGRPYKIVLDEKEQIKSFVYGIDDNFFLHINRLEDGFFAEKIPVNYERKILHIGGLIKDNLIASLGEGKENLLLALQLSDIFAWDIDFAADLRKDDSFKMVVLGLYLNGAFKKYGNILSAEFSNNGEVYRAYAFGQNEKITYYDEAGKSLRKAFLKAPLSFRRISSSFARGRYHPILKIYRPHHGLDYAAASGTPVSAAGDGRVVFAGKRGQYGNLIIIRHRNGYETYYGHLSAIRKGIRQGAAVDQGAIIGYVGATGLATGPHLHYEMRINGRPVNPMAIKSPPGVVLTEEMLVSFGQFKERMNRELALIKPANHLIIGKAPTR